MLPRPLVPVVDTSVSPCNSFCPFQRLVSHEVLPLHVTQAQSLSRCLCPIAISGFCGLRQHSNCPLGHRHIVRHGEMSPYMYGWLYMPERVTSYFRRPARLYNTRGISYVSVYFSTDSSQLLHIICLSCNGYAVRAWKMSTSFRNATMRAFNETHLASQFLEYSCVCQAYISGLSNEPLQASLVSCKSILQGSYMLGATQLEGLMLKSAILFTPCESDFCNDLFDEKS